jgi:hypothetical protein
MISPSTTQGIFPEKIVGMIRSTKPFRINFSGRQKKEEWGTFSTKKRKNVKA